MSQLPRFHEHEQDCSIPFSYGIDESHDGGFYPYRIAAPGHLIIYLVGIDGLDMRGRSYKEALAYAQDLSRRT